MLGLISKKPIIVTSLLAIAGIYALSETYANLHLTTLYTITLLSIAILSALSFGGIYYYVKAKELAPTMKDKSDLLGEIKVLQQTKSRLQDEYNAAENTILQKEEAEKWLTENKERIETLRNSIETAAEDLDKKNNYIREKMDELDTINQQLENKNKKCSDAEDNLRSIQCEHQTCLEQIKELNKEKESLDLTITSLKKSKVKESIELKYLKRINNQCQIQDKDKWFDLDRHLITSYTPRNFDAVSEEVDWLENFKNSLTDHGIIFDERILYAFHTAIKCSEISPLVVLAGVSGTGKSLLPELYSAASGMNFLSVAVQPRWDSPQDMLGFFNYMDGRYKATELSRFLWQLDTYNNKENPHPFNYHPMNMVLLDEMNLAKVEYYFSDLLSKLEIRRGLDPNDDSIRSKSEIEFECGASGRDNRRLYVSSDVLFVGTMNEDESTQTLSDKVLDRSNVIRFGRPKNLDFKPKKKELLKLFESSPVVTADVWKNWCSNQQTVASEMTQLGEINEYLEQVGRPFAHRVWQAMETYILLYPKNTGNYQRHIKRAISDQIEMKILPKLDGLELEIPGFDKLKDKLIEVIDKTEDKGLLDTFNEACDSSKQVYFKWRGVKR